MIAKSFLIALLTSGAFSISVSGKSGNKYQRILEEYDIHPPGLEYGYPIWYQPDSVPPTAIIFLKSNLDELVKIDNITYISEPTKENAQIVSNFSGEMGELPIYYIIPDSNLMWRDVLKFVEAMFPTHAAGDVRLCGFTGYYAKIAFQETTMIFPEAYRWSGCYRYHNIFNIMSNQVDELLVDGKPVQLDSLSGMIFQFYTANYHNDIRPDLPERHFISAEACKKEINSLEHVLSESIDTNLKAIFERDLERWMKWKACVDRHGTLSLFSDQVQIWLRFQRGNRLVGSYYRQLNQVNKGLLYSRHWISERCFGQGYEALLREGDKAKLGLIHLEFPDLIRYEFCLDCDGDCFCNYLAPEPIEIPEDTIEVVPPLIPVPFLNDSSKAISGQ
jgi:hypothetical protein